MMSCTRDLGSDDLLLAWAVSRQTCTYKYESGPTSGFTTFCLSSFFCYWTFRKLIGDSVNVSKCTVGRCCRAVTDAINSLRHDFIFFPRDERARQTKQEFFNIAGKQNVNLLNYSVCKLHLLSVYDFARGITLVLVL